MEGPRSSTLCAGDGPPLPGQCPAVALSLDWTSWAEVHLVCPLAAQVVLSALFLVVLHPAYVEAYHRNQSFRWLVKTYLGTRDRPKVARPLGLVVFSTVQVLASLVAVGIWIYHTYQRRTSELSRSILLALAFVDVACWVSGRLSASCEFSSLWELNAIVDLSTSVPVFARALGLSFSSLNGGYDAWLSLHFLRSYSALNSFERARQVAQLDEHTAGLAQVRAQLALRVVSLLTVMAGTIFTFEVLGDPPWLRDSFVETESADYLSFIQMVYWIVISITTVGYGDFAPRTVLTRVMTTVFIVVGVASIYIIQYTFAELAKHHHEGTGRYWHARGQRRHVVVVLNHEGEASRTAPLIHGLLQELMHSSHNHDEDHHDRASSLWSHFRNWCRGGIRTQTWPDVVFLSPTKWEPEHGNDQSFQKFLETTEDFPRNVRSCVWFLVGEATNPADLDRARVKDSALTYVLSDLRSRRPDEEDAYTIHLAVVLRDLHPEVRLRLMVNKPESKILALQAGFETTRCFSTRELAASIMAQNARCRGLLPAVAALVKSVDADDREFFLRQGSVQHPPAHEQERGSASRRDLTSSRGLPSVIEGSAAATSSSRKRRSSSSSSRQYDMAGPWMHEYLTGMGHNAFGFSLHRRFDGLGFGALALSAYLETGTILLGVQVRGRVVLCPQAKAWKARAGMICFAIARSASDLDPLRLDARDRTSWRNAFQVSRRRRKAENDRHSRGRRMEAAEMIGQPLKRVLLPPRHDACVEVGDGFATNDSLDREEHVLDDRFAAVVRRDTRTASEPEVTVSRELEMPVNRQYTEVTRSASYANLEPVTRQSTMANLEIPDEFVRQELLTPPARTAPGAGTVQGSRQQTAASKRQEEAEAVRALRENLQSWDELVVVIVCHGDIWQMVRTFLRTLRQDYLPTIQPVVVLAPTSPPPGLLQDYSYRVACMQGSFLQAQTLVEAGLLEASAVVVLAGEPTHRSRMSDHHVLLCGQVLECWLGASPRSIFASFELRESASAVHLPKLRGRGPSEDLHEWAKAKGGRAAGEASTMSRRTSPGGCKQGTIEAGWANADSGDTVVSPGHTINRFKSADSIRHGDNDAPPSENGKQSEHAIFRFKSADSIRHGDNDAPPSENGKQSEHAIFRYTSLDSVRRAGSEIDPDGEAQASRRRSFLPFNSEIDVGEEMEAPVWNDEDGSDLATESDDEELGAGIEDAGHNQKSLWETLRESSGRDAVAQEKSHQSIMFHPRFAAGQIFTPELWGTMLGRMFYNPASIELLEALVMPASRGQNVYPWQLRVPVMYVGRPVADLIMDLTLGVHIRNSTCRPSRFSLRSSEVSAENTAGVLANETAHGPPAVLMALYRLRAEFGPGDRVESPNAPDDVDPSPDLRSPKPGARPKGEGIGGHRYVMLAPAADLELRNGDCAIVLGGGAFGKGLFDRGMLHRE